MVLNYLEYSRIDQLIVKSILKSKTDFYNKQKTTKNNIKFVYIEFLANVFFSIHLIKWIKAGMYLKTNNEGLSQKYMEI